MVLGIVPECGMSFQIFLWSLIGITYKSPSHPSHLNYRYNILFHIKKKKTKKKKGKRTEWERKEQSKFLRQMKINYYIEFEYFF